MSPTIWLHTPTFRSSGSQTPDERTRRRSFLRRAPLFGVWPSRPMPHPGPDDTCGRPRDRVRAAQAALHCGHTVDSRSCRPFLKTSIILLQSRYFQTALIFIIWIPVIYGEEALHLYFLLLPSPCRCSAYSYSHPTCRNVSRRTFQRFQKMVKFFLSFRNALQRGLFPIPGLIRIRCCRNFNVYFTHIAKENVIDRP